MLWVFGIKERDLWYYLFVRKFVEFNLFVTFRFHTKWKLYATLQDQNSGRKYVRTTWHRLNGFLLLWLHNTRINELHFLRGHVMPDCKGSFSRLHRTISSFLTYLRTVLIDHVIENLLILNKAQAYNWFIKLLNVDYFAK